jgi:hypothetical protein
MISLLLSWRATLPANDDRTTTYPDEWVSPAAGPDRRSVERCGDRGDDVVRDGDC